MSRRKTIAIVGGGVSGLAAGVLLARRGIGVRLFEANEKLGLESRSTLPLRRIAASQRTSLPDGTIVGRRQGRAGKS